MMYGNVPITNLYLSCHGSWAPYADRSPRQLQRNLADVDWSRRQLSTDTTVAVWLDALRLDDVALSFEDIATLCDLDTLVELFSHIRSATPSTTSEWPASSVPTGGATSTFSIPTVRKVTGWLWGTSRLLTPHSARCRAAGTLYHPRMCAHRSGHSRRSALPSTRLAGLGTCSSPMRLLRCS